MMKTIIGRMRSDRVNVSNVLINNRPIRTLENTEQ